MTSENNNHENSILSKGIRGRAMTEKMVGNAKQFIDENKQQLLSNKNAIERFVLDTDYSYQEVLEKIFQIGMGREVDLEEEVLQLPNTMEDIEDSSQRLLDFILPELVVQGIINRNIYKARSLKLIEASVQNMQAHNYDNRYAPEGKVRRLFVQDEELVDFVVTLLNDPNYYQDSKNVVFSKKRNIEKFTEAVTRFVSDKSKEMYGNSEVTIKLKPLTVARFLVAVSTAFPEKITFDPTAGISPEFIGGRIEKEIPIWKGNLEEMMEENPQTLDYLLAICSSKFHSVQERVNLIITYLYPDTEVAFSNKQTFKHYSEQIKNTFQRLLEEYNSDINVFELFLEQKYKFIGRGGKPTLVTYAMEYFLEDPSNNPERMRQTIMDLAEENTNYDVLAKTLTFIGGSEYMEGRTSLRGQANKFIDLLLKYVEDFQKISFIYEDEIWG